MEKKTINTIKTRDALKFLKGNIDSSNTTQKI